VADDWRIRVEVKDVPDTLIERLGVDIDDEARELARGLEQHRLAVSRDGDEIFVYASSRQEAENANALVAAELQRLGVQARTSRVEHWLEAEERWDDEPPSETWEEDELDRGYAPWEVRAQCASRQEAKALAEQLEAEGYRPIRQFRYLIVGTASREEADQLAQRVHGEVESGGEVVWETAPGNPFAVFGGLGQ